MGTVAMVAAVAAVVGLAGVVWLRRRVLHLETLAQLARRGSAGLARRVAALEGDAGAFAPVFAADVDGSRAAKNRDPRPAASGV